MKEETMKDAVSAKQNHSRIEYMTMTAMLAVAALMLSYIESLFPIVIGLPGFKLGLANILTVAALYSLGTRYALSLNLTRIFLVGLLFGTPFSLIYSLAGGLLSLLVMVLLKKTGVFSIVGVSMAGGAAHELGQLMVAAAILTDIKIFIYFPALLIAGVVTGIVNGFIAYIIIKKMPGKFRPEEGRS